MSVRRQHIDREDLSRMRSEYSGRADRAGALPATGWTQFATLVRRRRRGGPARAQRDGARHRRRQPAGRARARCCSRGTTSADSCSSPTTARARAATSREPAASPGLPLVPAARQVIVIGARRAGSTATETEEYFALRPRGSQLGAWASPQSRVIRSRGELEARGPRRSRSRGEPCRPRRTGAGSGSARTTVEFWQGRASRLHDRLRYRLATGAAGVRRAARAVTAVAAEPAARARKLAIDVRPLRHAAYRRLFVGQRVSVLRVPVHRRRRPGAGVRASPCRSLWVGMLGLVGLVPLIVFALWGGAVADAVDRRKLLLASSRADLAGHARAAGPGAARARQPGADAGAGRGPVGGVRGDLADPAARSCRG